jgi:hypothetical protein
VNQLTGCALAGSWDIRFFEPTIGMATRMGFIPDHYVDITSCPFVAATLQAPGKS